MSGRQSNGKPVGPCHNLCFTLVALLQGWSGRTRSKIKLEHMQWQGGGGRCIHSCILLVKSHEGACPLGNINCTLKRRSISNSSWQKKSNEYNPGLSITKFSSANTISIITFGSGKCSGPPISKITLLSSMFVQRSLASNSPLPLVMLTKTQSFSLRIGKRRPPNVLNTSIRDLLLVAESVITRSQSNRQLAIGLSLTAVSVTFHYE